MCNDFSFPKNWLFLRSAPKLCFLPDAGPLEVAFCGRSNVGKSSLINSLTYSKSLARTSNTPGRTQELNFFIPNGFSGEKDDLPPFVLVDMPGYGYAQAPKSIVKQWTNLVFDYLRGRPTLRRVYILIDSRHGIKENDKIVLDILDKTAVSYQIILTKIDKIKSNSLDLLKEKTLNNISKRPAAYPEILFTSSEKNVGIAEVQNAILQVVSY